MCEHGRLKTVGDRVFCCVCGTELTLDFLLAKNKPAKAENRANKTDEELKADKPSPKKRTAKKAV